MLQVGSLRRLIGCYSLGRARIGNSHQRGSNSAADFIRAVGSFCAKTNFACNCLMRLAGKGKCWTRRDPRSACSGREKRVPISGPAQDKTHPAATFAGPIATDFPRSRGVVSPMPEDVLDSQNPTLAWNLLSERRRGPGHGLGDIVRAAAIGRLSSGQPANLRHLALVELIKVDLEYRCQRPEHAQRASSNTSPIFPSWRCAARSPAI